MKVICFLLILFSSIVKADNANPLKDFAPSIVLEETGEVLKLRGTGLFRHLGQDYYLGAFYSLNDVKDPRAALEDKGSKRMVFLFLRPTSHFKEIFETAIEVNNSPELIEREQINIGQFLDYFSKPLTKDQTIILDFIPNVGIKVSMDGAYKGTIKGEQLNSLILKTWMGRQPPSKNFQKDLFYLSKGIHL